ncbi:hypothetical protein D3C84_1238820 [compost metagenome]
MLVVGGNWQQSIQVDLAMHHLLTNCIADFAPRQGIEAGRLETRQHFSGLHAHRLGHPLPVGQQAGNHRNRVAARLGKQ